MGIPSPTTKARSVLCVGGGLGVAHIFPQARGFRESGAHVTAVLGFRTASLVFWEDKFRSVCDDLIICTNDGSAGMKGLTTDGIRAALARHPDIVEVVAIGPPLMMQACAEATRPHRIKTIVSVNPIMWTARGCAAGAACPSAGRRSSCAWTGPSSTGTRWTSTT